MTAVWDVLRARAADGSAPGARNDPHKVALVLEGGGMRGVVSIGLAAGLAAAGLAHGFDSIHGSSAGGCAAAYFAAGQPDLGGSIYFEDINNSAFIDLARPLRGRAVMDLDYLVRDVMVRRKPLDAARLVGQRGYVNIVLTEAATGKSVTISEFTSADDVLDCLRASAFIPVIAGTSAGFRGQRYVDGGIVQQVALQSAIDSGATHVLAVMTRKQDSLLREENPLLRGFEHTVLSLLYSAALADVYAHRAEGINRTVHALASHAPLNGVELGYLIPPDSIPDLNRLSRNGPELKAAFDLCRQHAMHRLADPAADRA